jgi:predicted nucleic acid-binding protein
LIVLDTSFVVALLWADDEGHHEAAEFYAKAEDRFATTPLVLAEIDYMLHSRATPDEAQAFNAEIRAGSMGVEWWPKLDVQAAEIADRHAEIGLGLTDASLIALAGRLETTRIASFDERHFRAVEPLNGGSFELLPADAQKL